MPRRLALVAALAVPFGLSGLMAPAGGAAPRSGTTAVRPDARAFATATLAFDLARGKAVGRAQRRGDERRSAARDCLDTLRTVPAERRAEVYTLYFTWVSAGYFAEDEPIFARWLRRLKAVRTEDPRLRAARATLGRQLTGARSAYAQGRAFCAPVGRWAAANWQASARPAVVRRLAEVASGSTTNAGIAVAARLLKRAGGQGGSLAADVLREGVDEPDAIVVRGDDPIVALLRD